MRKAWSHVQCGKARSEQDRSLWPPGAQGVRGTSDAGLAGEASAARQCRHNGRRGRERRPRDNPGTCRAAEVCGLQAMQDKGWTLGQDLKTKLQLAIIL